MALAPIPLSFWTMGINSLLPPVELAKQQYAWGENIINRGGIVQTRPGRRAVASIPGKRPQGFTVFKPKGSTARLVAAVDGLIYVMKWPDFVPVKLDGIQMNPLAEKVHFCGTLKSTEYNPDGSLRLIDPNPILMISDGANRTAYWDGKVARHLNPDAHETPICTWMAWIASRLWMAMESKIFVSDLTDPLNHREAVYLSGRDGFELSSECTGLIATPNRAGILAFTKDDTTVFKANIRDRNTWNQTPDFQDLLLPKIGCTAGRTACNQYGATYWMSERGLVSLDIAFVSTRSNRIVTNDEQMMRSRRKLSADHSGACAIGFENLMFCSVPSGSKYNNQTWVMDQAVMGSAQSAASAYNQSSSGVWASIWTGTRPVQWATGEVGGKNRLYSLCYDKSAKDDTRIHIWEDMLSDRKDAGGRIKCQWITGGIGSSDLIRFNFAKFEAVEILGDVTLSALVCGTRGPWYDIGSWNLQAEEGCFNSSLQPFISADSTIEAYKPQSRPLVTKEFVPEGKEVTAEFKPYGPGVDKAFQLCFEWTGRMGIRELTVNISEGPQENHGAPACIGEDGSGGEKGQVNAITETGNKATVQPT